MNKLRKEQVSKAGTASPAWHTLVNELFLFKYGLNLFH